MSINIDRVQEQSLSLKDPLRWLSHEIQNPVSAILINVQFVEHSLGEETLMGEVAKTKLIEALASIRRSAERISDTLDRLIAVDRPT